MVTVTMVIVARAKRIELYTGLYFGIYLIKYSLLNAIYLIIYATMNI